MNSEESESLAARTVKTEDDLFTINSKAVPELILDTSIYSSNSVNLTVKSSVPGRVWCIVRKEEDPIPSISFMKTLLAHPIDKKVMIHFDRLEPSTPYIAYCFAESNDNVQMVEAIPDVAESFTTKHNPIPCTLHLTLSLHHRYLHS